MRINYILAFLLVMNCLFGPAYAQGGPTNDVLFKRVLPAPETVFTMFREAGMKPVNHVLNAVEKRKVEQALAELPPLHRRVLDKHLHSLSFMDNMPNNGLTSPVAGSAGQFNITLRAGILGETISAWATKKEQTSFNLSADSAMQVSVELGKLDAILYVLLHEATHVVDAVMHINPKVKTREDIVAPTDFTKGVWSLMNRPVAAYADSLLRNASIRNSSVQLSLAPQVYTSLSKTPFVSLYGAAAWSEDLAEFLTIYHLTDKLRQPYKIVVRNNGKVITSFEPMQNDLVKSRKKFMQMFYEEKGAVSQVVK